MADKPEARVARALIEQAMADVAQIRREYVRASLIGVGNDESLLKRFQAEVLNYYLVLRPQREAKPLGEKWQNARLWRTETGQWVTGIDELGTWIGETRTEYRSRPGRTSRKEQVEVPDVQPGERLMRVSTVLDDVAKGLGVTINVSNAQRPAGMVGDDEEENQADDGADQDVEIGEGASSSADDPQTEVVEGAD